MELLLIVLIVLIVGFENALKLAVLAFGFHVIAGPKLKLKSNTPLSYYIFRSELDPKFVETTHKILQESNWHKYRNFERTYILSNSDISIYLKSNQWLEPYHKNKKFYPSGKQIRWSITSKVEGENPIVYINAKSWINGVEESGLSLDRYKTYVINHEFGHALGYTHKECTGDVCPVMYQSTRGCPADTVCGYQPDERDIA